jgi:septal ring factor EnvC (AmiA/AmiB activator)
MGRRLILAPAVLVLCLAGAAASQTPGPPLIAPAVDPQQAAVVDREVKRLQRELVRLGRAEAGGERAAVLQRRRLNLLNTREKALKQRIDANRENIVRLLAALQTYQRQPPPALLVSPRSAKDAVRAAILIRAITPELEGRGRRLAAEAEAIRQVRRDAAAASEALFQAESEKADRQADVETLLVQKRDLERRLYGGTEQAEAEVRALADTAGNMSELVQGLAARGGADGPADGPPSRLLTPVQGVLASRFGQRAPGRVRTEGWTYRTGANAIVLSPADARIEYAGPLKDWGLVMILGLPGGYHLVLAGMHTADAAVGRRVAVGEPIGRMAGTLRPPPELYLEIRKEATPVDPARWLGGTARS